MLRVIVNAPLLTMTSFIPGMPEREDTEDTFEIQKHLLFKLA